MVTVAQDIKWAFVGDKVTLRASSLTGDRARFKVAAKPTGSAIEVFDAGKENYLEARGDAACVITPDEDGYYTITAIDETVTYNVKHYSNDGGVGLSKGVESAATVASASHTLWVGRVMQRRMGLSPDNITLTVHAHSSAGSTGGVLTYYAGAGYAPTLSGATTDKADMAMQASAVTAAIAYYGGYGYPGTANMIRVNGSPTSFFEYGRTLYGRLALGLTQHLTYTANRVHDAADATNSMAAVSAPTTEATLVTYTNTFRGKVIAHFALGTGAAHPHGADTTNTIGAACTNLATAIIRLADIRAKVELHRVLYTSEAHHPPGDNTLSAIMPYQLIQSNEATAAVCAHATTIAAAWNAHLAVTTISAAAYHAATSSVNAPQSTTPNDLPDLIEKTNDLVNRLEAHAQNKNIETGSSVTYHSPIKDLGCKVPLRANDALSVIETLESALWAYQHHTLTGEGGWHGGSTNNPGVAHVEARSATTQLQLAILSKLQEYDTSSPPNTLKVVDDLISRAGFTSV